MLVRDHMTQEVVTLSAGMEVLKALMVLAEHDIAGAPVVDAAGTVVGVLTEKDCLKRALAATYHSEYGGLVAEYMSSPARTMARTTVWCRRRSSSSSCPTIDILS